MHFHKRKKSRKTDFICRSNYGGGGDEKTGKSCVFDEKIHTCKKFVGDPRVVTSEIVFRRAPFDQGWIFRHIFMIYIHGPLSTKVRIVPRKLFHICISHLGNALNLSRLKLTIRHGSCMEGFWTPKHESCRRRRRCDNLQSRPHWV